MVETALIFISIFAVISLVGTGAVILYYKKAREPDYYAASGAFIGLAGVIELSMANQYLQDNLLFNTFVIACLGPSVISAIVSVRQSKTEIQLWNNNAK